MISRVKLLTILMCTVFSVNAYSAEISPSGGFVPLPEGFKLDKPGTLADSYQINLKGIIERGDYDKITSTIKARGSFPTTIFVDSPGGDVLEAVKIARFIRRSMIHVRSARKECNSACAYLIFSNVKYPAYITIGIHRPYFDKHYFAGLSSAQATKKYQQLQLGIRKFLLEMNVPTSLIDQMMATSSDNIKYISMNEYIKTNGKTAPAFDEWIRARCGSFSFNEKLDYSLAIVSPSLGLELPDELEKERQAMSAGYKEYLVNKFKKMKECESNSIETEQKKILSELLKK